MIPTAQAVGFCSHLSPITYHLLPFTYHLSSLTQLNHLRFLHFPRLDFKAQDGAHVVETVLTGGAGVHVNHAEGVVKFHHADVRVAANE